MSQSVRARGLEGMINHSLHGLHETGRTREFRMHLERLLVCPARMNEEKARISGRAKGVDRKAAGLAPRCLNLLREHACGRRLASRPHMETCKNKKLHRNLRCLPNANATRA